MIYLTTHWLNANRLCVILEEEEIYCRIKYLDKQKEEEWIHIGWLREYVLNKGEYCYAI